ncbi:M20/M25/M40 family metallo-hydrolase [bacterium]|nr:M20/M25/M40 family metallo-hydrolase [bacterium]
MKRVLLPLLFLTCLAAAFDAEAAFELLEEQMALGPRYPGSAGHESCKWWLVEQLGKYCDGLTLDAFDYVSPDGAHAFRLTNIIGVINPEATRRIMLGAHWDTRIHADEDPDPERRTDPVPGANDGASGVAVLLELARAFAEDPPAVGIIFVLFDGEDQGRIGGMEFCIGSEHLARQGPLRYAYGIVVDMIGDADLNILHEGNSVLDTPELVKRIWDTAADLGTDAFIPGLGHTVNDDHKPFLERGLPTVLIIDFDYDVWHTVDDTPEHCSPESLGAVGRVLEKLIRSE